MGITLTGKTINSTYDSLLKLLDNDSLTGAFKVITDGLGNDTGISVNNNGDVVVSNTLAVSTRISTPLLQLTGGTGTQGELSWNADEETLDVVNNGAVLQLGQEIHVHVRNNSATVAIPNGTPVYVAGTLGASGRLKVAPMIADGSIGAEYFIGVTTEEIEAGGDGKVTWFGKVRDFDTSLLGEGNKLYVSETVAGGWQTNHPTSPNPKLEVAFTINAKSNGTVFIRSNNGYKLDDLHDVEIVLPANGDLLVYNSTLGRWENSKTIGDLTAANLTATSFIKSGGTSSQFLKADGSVDSTTYQDTTEKGQALGYAPLDSGGKVAEAYLPDSVLGQVEYQGTWNATTNTPTLPDPTTVKGHFYIVSVAGTYLTIDYQVGDWVISNGVDWSKVDNTDAVTTFNGRLGSIVPLSTDYDSFFYTKTLLDGGQLDNRYYTEAELNAGQLDNRYYTETELTNGQLDTRYYTETEINSFFSGGTAISGYNKTNWDNAFGWGNWATGVTKAYIDSLNVDADTLDSLNSTDFLRSNANDTYTGDLTVQYALTGLTLTDGTYSGALTVDASNRLNWNGDVLVTSIIAGQYVVNTGDTMTGSLTIENTAPLYKLKDNNSTGANASYGQIQWYDQLDAEIATIGFYGLDSNFYIDAYGSDVVIGDNLNVLGGLSVDTNTFYVDATNNNIGVGTTSPDIMTSSTSSITLNGTNANVSGGLAYQINGATKAYHYVESGYLWHQGVSGVGHRFLSGVTTTMLLSSGGDLDVTGTIAATGGNSTNWNTAYSWGNHATVGYLTSYTETDPIYVASSWYTTTNNSNNWNTAFGWGDWSTGVTKTFVDALNVDADTLDSLNSTQFLRSDVNTTLNGDLTISKAGSAVFRMTNTTAIQSWIAYVGSGDEWIFRDETDARTAMILKGTGDVEFSGGNVSFGGSTASYKVDVTGSIRATGDILAYSDVRVKENIYTIENALDITKKMRGVFYNKIGEATQRVGVIAQETEKVLPQVVSEDADGMKSVAYGNIIGLHTEAIKQLATEKDREIAELKARISKLEQLNA